MKYTEQNKTIDHRQDYQPREMRRGARAPLEPSPFCSLSDARAAVIPVHRNAGSDGVLSRSSIPHTPVYSSNPFVLSISGSRYSRTQGRSICCRLVPYVHTSLSLSVALCLCLVLCYPVALTVFVLSCFPFYLFFILFYRLYDIIWVQSRVLVRTRS